MQTNKTTTETSVARMSRRCGELGITGDPRNTACNLAIGLDLSDREIEAVVGNSAMLIREKASLLGQKRRQAPILRRLLGSACEYPDSDAALSFAGRAV